MKERDVELSIPFREGEKTIVLLLVSRAIHDRFLE